SRHDTGQFRRVKACELSGWKSVDACACSLSSPAWSLAEAPPWLPIVHILADYALPSPWPLSPHSRGQEAPQKARVPTRSACVGATVVRSCPKGSRYDHVTGNFGADVQMPPRAVTGRA